MFLDEATSVLDATSRILVFEAMKRWRRNMTTIVITHDLSQISSDDFVHVLKDGKLIEQGFRHELESFESKFTRMARTQDAKGGFKEKDMKRAPLTSFPSTRSWRSRTRRCTRSARRSN